MEIPGYGDLCVTRESDMPGSGKRFQGAFDGYAKFLRDGDLASALGAGEIARAGRGSGR